MLYCAEEVCFGCNLAVFHYCCGHFCRCVGNHETEIDFKTGKCSHYKPKGKDGIIVIDAKEVAERLKNKMKVDESAGWSNSILDILEDLYRVETAICEKVKEG